MRKLLNLRKEIEMADNETAFGPDQEADADSPREASATPESAAELAAALAAAEARAEENWTRCLRTAAELDNVRKRAARDVERARAFGLEPFANELLQVRDSLEMGLDAAGAEPTVEALREGTMMTLRQLEAAMEKFGIEQIDPLGQVFDPTLHEAMVTQPSAEVAPDTVLEVVQKGYTLNGRLLRPARVIVARAPD